MTVGQSVASEMMRARLALKHLGKDSRNEPAIRARQGVFTRPPHRSGFTQENGPPTMGTSDRSGHLVTFAYVVALSDNREDGYDPRTAGTDRVRSVIRSA